MALPDAASSRDAAWWRLRAPRTSVSDIMAADSLAVGSVVVVWLLAVEEGIVGLHGVWLDDEVVGPVVTGDDGLGWFPEPAGKAGLVAEGAHEPGAEGLVSNGLDD